jgi:hypothetical protein
MPRRLTHAAGAALLIAALAACSNHNDAPPANQDDVSVFLSHDDEDATDCDADDKAKQEIPDCGFYAGPTNTTFVWWTWVKAGHTAPPAGWSAAREVEPYRKPSSTPKPKPSKRPAGPTTKPSKGK